MVQNILINIQNRLCICKVEYLDYQVLQCIDFHLLVTLHKLDSHTLRLMIIYHPHLFLNIPCIRCCDNRNYFYTTKLFHCRSHHGPQLLHMYV